MCTMKGLYKLASGRKALLDMNNDQMNLCVLATNPWRTRGTRGKRFPTAPRKTFMYAG